MPFKANHAQRHRIPRQRHRVTNWPAYDAALQGRGSLTVWFTAEAIAAWRAVPRTTRGGQPHYSDLAIATALTLRAVFRLALRQTEGLIRSILHLLGLDLAVPDHSTMSRRARSIELPRCRVGRRPVHLLVDSTGLRLCGPGEWLVERHGARTRRLWRKLHLATNADTGEIAATELTGHDADDGGQVEALLGGYGGPIASFTADGAYDRDDVYAAVAARSRRAAVVIPPRSSAVLSTTDDTQLTQRDEHVAGIAAHGRIGWQRRSGYNWRALVEADVSRWKRVIGDGLRSRTDDRRSTEVAIAARALNRMLELGRPEYVRIV
ncbi:MAG: IS5 family transposase [Myxococcales bacterium]|nr:IS5 family transposase [Myxococcales bacterium]